MEERAQAATEYLLMVALALSVVSTVVAVSFDIFDSIGSQIEETIGETENDLINSLK